VLGAAVAESAETDSNAERAEFSEKELGDLRELRV
jgi:hypothetical protein